MPSLDQILLAMEERLAEMERRMAGFMRHGRVTDVDPKKQLARLRLNPDDEKDEHKTAWVPYAQLAGSLKFHDPPAVGQNMTVLSMGGGGSDGGAMSIAFSFTWNDKFKSPGDKHDPHVLTYGAVKVTYQSGQQGQDSEQSSGQQSGGGTGQQSEALYRTEVTDKSSVTVKEKSITQDTVTINHKASVDINANASNNIIAKAGKNHYVHAAGTLHQHGFPILVVVPPELHPHDDPQTVALTGGPHPMLPRTEAPVPVGIKLSAAFAAAEPPDFPSLYIPFNGFRWHDTTTGIEYSWHESIWSEGGANVPFPPAPVIGDVFAFTGRRW